ncbi:MAG: hypothetical protein GTO53_03170, partial [Planctomycetales bacterium]|nr:hypothetical protein [Planctomycetales bacterium]NIM08166.1 hypothetical protein [Planctomycetales bacterium]NIN07663.1 hypothetical protein [Planctomycetales bacterium]NIN76780.1 hypothetical protein [Planctomycetales bacterium]NIP03841.1 hypothetical protein [Planctomycetales bacterium]
MVVAASAFATHWVGTIHAYGATVTGITCAVVILPELVFPSGGMELALSRVVCTLLGVIAVTVVTFPFTPPRKGIRPS